MLTDNPFAGLGSDSEDESKPKDVRVPSSKVKAPKVCVVGGGRVFTLFVEYEPDIHLCSFLSFPFRRKSLLLPSNPNLLQRASNSYLQPEVALIRHQSRIQAQVGVRM